VHWRLLPMIGLLASITILSVHSIKAKAAAAIVGFCLIVGGFVFEAKLWGVILMGLSLALFFFLPWLDRSPVKSIRYRGWMYKTALGVFVVSFVVLGYLGTKNPDHVDLLLMKNVRWAQTFTIIYFLFFLLMPWYTTLDKTKPVPERVTWK